MAKNRGPVRVDEAPRPQAGESIADVLEMQTTSRTGDVAVAQSTAQATAMVQARYVMAIQRPRNFDDVRVRLEKECQRTGFAEAAWYKLPFGEKAEGFSIRFAEAALRCMSNMRVDSFVVYEDDETRTVHVDVIDLETNASWGADVPVRKTVERRFPKDDDIILRWRTNSEGGRVAIIVADDATLFSKQQNYIARVSRTLVLKHLPGDIQDSCERIIKDRIAAKQSGGGDKDPDATKKQMIDVFASLRIMPTDLLRYLGHDLDRMTAAEIGELYSIAVAIGEGLISWEEVLAGKEEERKDATAEATAAAEERQAAGDEPEERAPDPEPEQEKPAPRRRVNRKAATLGDLAAAAPPPVAQAMAEDPEPAADDDAAKDEKERAQIITELAAAEADLPPDTVQACYDKAGVSMALESFDDVATEQLVALRDALKLAPRLTPEVIARTLSEKDQIRYVSLARMDKGTAFHAAAKKQKLKGGEPPSSMTPEQRAAIIAECFGSTLPKLP